MNTLDKLAYVVKGVFASSSGEALAQQFGTAQNIKPFPLQVGNYLSPMPPLPAIGPRDYEARRFDYRLGINLDYTPGDGKFPILRYIADGFNVLRSVIDTKKDLLAAVPWSIKRDPAPGETKRIANDKSQKDPIVKQLTNFFNCPDGEHTWFQWIRSFLEEVYVIDAGSILVRRDDDDKIASLDAISGDTIQRLIDSNGCLPPPSRDAGGRYQAAYAQIASGSGGSGGVPQTYLSQRDLLYAMRNPRPNRRWGQSSVEKVIQYGMTGMYADEFIKLYYTAGSQPEGFIFLDSDQMTPTQIEEYSKKYNAAFQGNLATRRGIAFLPGGSGGKNSQFVPTKETLLKPDIYDQLVRSICAEFSIPSVPWEKPMNRASAQESGEQAEEAGLEPDIQWLQGVINLLVKSDLYFGLDGYSFVFGPRRDVDPVKQSIVDTNYLKNAAITVDEVREDLGKEPFAPKIPEAGVPGVMTPNNGFIPLSVADAQPLLAARQKPATPPGAPQQPATQVPPKPNKKDKAATIDPDKLTPSSIHGKEHIQSTLTHAFARMKDKTKKELQGTFRKG
jgi:portal protein